MQLIPVKTRLLEPPQDNLYSALEAAFGEVALEERDVVVIASKVVAIAEGRCVRRDSVASKDELIKAESDLYLPRAEVPGNIVMHSILHGQLAVAAGVDPFGAYYVLWPEDPMASATRIHDWLKEYTGLSNLGVIVSDSKSTPFRRGVVGGAIGWAGFSPLYDNRARTDFYGEPSGGSQINVADAVAASAVLAMGEGNEQTPVVIVRGVPYIQAEYEPRKEKATSYVVAPDEDIFAPFFSTKRVPWEIGGRSAN